MKQPPPSTSRARRRCSRRGGMLAAGVAAMVGASGPALAQPRDPPTVARCLAPSPCAGALANIVAHLVSALPPAAKRSVIVGAPLQSDRPALRADSLPLRLAQLVAGALGPEATALSTAMSLDQARAHAQHGRMLVWVQPTIRNGKLAVTADAYAIADNIWQRALDPHAGPVGHSFAEARLDAEVQSFLAPIPLIASNTLRVPLTEPEVLSVMCDDIDGDGALELLLVSRRNVMTARIRQAGLLVQAHAAWDTLSPIAPSPWREPLATLALPVAGRIDIGSTDRKHAVRVDESLRRLALLNGMPLPVPEGNACTPRQAGALSGELHRCTPADPAPRAPVAPFPFDAAAATSGVQRDGQPLQVAAARRSSDASVVVRDSLGREVTIAKAGAQVALGDLDLDGQPEVLTTRDVLDPSQDGLSVWTWRSDGALERRMDVPVPQGIVALSVCPAEGTGMRAIAMVTKQELWIVR